MAAADGGGISRWLAAGTFLVPAVGDFRTRQIGAIAGSFIVLALAYLLIDWVGAGNAGHLLAVGAFWLVLTLAFEFGLGRFGFGTAGSACWRITRRSSANGSHQNGVAVVFE